MSLQKTNAFWGVHPTEARHAWSMCCPSCQNFRKSNTVSWFASVIGYRPDSVSLAAVLADAAESDIEGAENIVVHECPLCFEKFWLHIDSHGADIEKYKASPNWPAVS